MPRLTWPQRGLSLGRTPVASGGRKQQRTRAARRPYRRRGRVSHPRRAPLGRGARARPPDVARRRRSRGRRAGNDVAALAVELGHRVGQLRVAAMAAPCRLQPLYRPYAIRQTGECGGRGAGSVAAGRPDYQHRDAGGQRPGRCRVEGASRAPTLWRWCCSISKA